METFASEIDQNARVGICWIYDGDNYDLTAYGNLWRDRLEIALAKQGRAVLPRKDYVVLVDDIESFGKNITEDDLLDAMEPDIIVTGVYYRHGRKPEKGPFVELMLKAYRLDEKRIVAAFRYEIPAPDEKDLKRMADVKGNVIRVKFRQIVGGASPAAPSLKAQLNRTCFVPGENAVVTAQTEPGVHIYLFSVQADGSVTRIVPNPYVPDKPVGQDGKFAFPDIYSDFWLDMPMHPVRPGVNEESFKMVASRKPLDFSFIPFPENEPFYGIDAGELRRVLDVLENADSASVVDIPYKISEGCF